MAAWFSGAGRRTSAPTRQYAARGWRFKSRSAAGAVEPVGSPMPETSMTGGGVSRIVLYNRDMSNIVSGRQIRAARMLAGLTQADLARAVRCHPRSVRYWENKGNNPPTNVASTLDHIEQALNQHGVVPFSTPTPGVRLL